MKLHTLLIPLLGLCFLAACQPGVDSSPTVTPAAAESPTVRSSPQPALSAEALSEILWVSDPSLPQYDPGSEAYADFPNLIQQITELGPDAIDAADDLAVALRYPRPDAYLAAQALLKLGPDITATTLPLLSDNLQQENSAARLYSLILLASVGERASCAVGEIAPHLWDTDPYARSASALALEIITGQDLVASEDEILITPTFVANSIPADSPEGRVVARARHWWQEGASQINRHPSYGPCDP